MPTVVRTKRWSCISYLVAAIPRNATDCASACCVFVPTIYDLLPPRKGCTTSCQMSRPRRDGMLDEPPNAKEEQSTDLDVCTTLGSFAEGSRGSSSRKDGGDEGRISVQGIIIILGRWCLQGTSYITFQSVSSISTRQDLADTLLQTSCDSPPSTPTPPKWTGTMPCTSHLNASGGLPELRTPHLHIDGSRLNDVQTGEDRHHQLRSRPPADPKTPSGHSERTVSTPIVPRPDHHTVGLISRDRIGRHARVTAPCLTGHGVVVDGTPAPLSAVTST